MEELVVSPRRFSRDRELALKKSKASFATTIRQLADKREFKIAVSCEPRAVSYILRAVSCGKRGEHKGDL